MKRRTLWRGVLAVVVCAIAFCATMAVRVYRYERSFLQAPAVHSLAITLERAHLPGVSEVRIPTAAGFDIAAWFAPPENGALVVVANGSEGDRSTMLDAIRQLRQAHVGIVAFDWPGRGLSGGPIEMNQAELTSLQSVISWAAARPGLSQEGLGALGFSYGAYMIARQAAFDTRIHRVALLGILTNRADVFRNTYHAWGPLAAWTALRACDILGVEPDTMPTVQFIGRIAPRPLLIVAGTTDAVVPQVLSERVFARAQEPRTFVSVAGAGHGDYFAVAPELMRTTLDKFFAPPHTGTVAATAIRDTLSGRARVAEVVRRGGLKIP